jgi:hypothetical protein
MDDMYFEALACAARISGDDELLMTDIEALPPHQATVVVPWDRESYIRVGLSHPIIAATDSALFGRSGGWGP